MRHYAVDNQNYYIFKANTVEKNPYVHFQWGKFDFRMIFNAGNKDVINENLKIAFSAANGEQYLAKTLEVFYQNEWFEFVKPTSHGIQLEEALTTLLVLSQSDSYGLLSLVFFLFLLLVCVLQKDFCFSVHEHIPCIESHFFWFF